jgi:uncharacterized tellurite resistance protein B-like protein
MRHYPKNSPEAAARLVALTLISDGQLKKAELAILESSNAHEKLGLRSDQLRAVVHELCADLLADAQARGESDCFIDAALIDKLLTDVDAIALRRTVLRLCLQVIHADGQVHDGESIVLLALLDQWGLDLAQLDLRAGA